MKNFAKVEASNEEGSFIKYIDLEKIKAIHILRAEVRDKKTLCKTGTADEIWIITSDDSYFAMNDRSIIEKFKNYTNVMHFSGKVCKEANDTHDDVDLWIKRDAIEAVSEYISAETGNKWVTLDFGDSYAGFFIVDMELSDLMNMISD